uniref:Palmitoyltransferase n=1 Tax=Podarcis muralis TaxID=64176 RepID=A0A670JJL8_PODMU|nr:probable palmitoyltransferase ZDHHC24 [Podarcis muralis]XP_028566020.1 probable palmitoyltransferase ZDHHC24 [Podarcis muralis]XP_028566109.1 probable palmitoyltransferase ZDHHC24 [Podarcis muralis]XP_028566110.1 probable palmitoyltransferase ZDHHC24 [Podarcis muralis]
MAGSGWERRVLPVCVGAALVGALALEVVAVLLLRQRGGGGERGSEAPKTEAFPFVSLASLLFLLGNVLENARRFVTASPSTRGVMLAGAGQGWDYCYSCQSHVPPRCSHCFSCNVCILRRDHHCTLLGQCLGYQNYRYFLCLLLHGSVALLYGCVINADVVLSLLQEGTSVQAMLLLLLPWLMLLMGQVNITIFIFAFVTDVCIVGFLFCTGFLLFHSLLALRGQTTNEWFEGDRQYDLGWKDNLREVLGNQGHLVWFMPFIASPLPGDGITFRTKCPQSEPLPKSRDL